MNTSHKAKRTSASIQIHANATIILPDILLDLRNKFRCSNKVVVCCEVWNKTIFCR